MPLSHFHPAVAAWFAAAFPAATPAQLAAWEAIRGGRHALVAAPTGSGKTLAAFMVAIDELVRAGLDGTLADETRVVYVSPLKALSNDIRINLEQPIAGIRAELAHRGLPDVEITSVVRTGDTPQRERSAMRRRAPHIVVTTPESLYILLGSESGRKMLASTRSVIVDEIHALAPNKRGAHLALSLERLQALCPRALLRIGLSATQRPIDEVARFLVGAAQLATDGTPNCRIVDIGHVRERDLAIVMPPAPLNAVMSNEVWEGVYDQLADLVRAHRTTLLFVNTRRAAERAARHLSERLGREVVAAHHGSLSRELRLDAEQRLKSGQLRVLCATASLELGIDIGDVELVCQLGSPRSIAALLQRVGRSGHSVGGTPKGRLFPQSRDDLAECVALLDAVRRGELDSLQVVHNALDVLAQQIVAEIAGAECGEAELFERLRRAWPYATLTREAYAAVVRMLSEGHATRRGPRAALLHRDAVHGVLRARRAARLTALTSGGAIPDTADYQVLLEPQSIVVGTLNEDFAVESLAGDVFQLGNTSYRVRKVEQGKVRVEDAQGAPPSMPFWLGEAPGRSDALSAAVSRLRSEIAERLDAEPPDAGAAVAAIDAPAPPSQRGMQAIAAIAAPAFQPAIAWLVDAVGVGEDVARPLVEYYASARRALGVLPTQETLAIERFFDESGGTQLVIHSPFGSRVNRAWGLALRKRFCRTFNFELQAAATEDAIILSLSTSHSFPLDEVTRYLHSHSVQEVLVQALLDAPMFEIRWRWNASISLALPRFSGGRRTAPQLQRMRAEDLLASVFPDQVACAENLVGERQIPDHPLVAQTLHDALHEAMDIDGLVGLLQRLESGALRIVCRDLTAPSPLAAEVLGARPYAYLDDAPLEERRTQAVLNRRLIDPEHVDDFGRLDPDAIAAVREEAWPTPRDVEEMHATLLDIGFVTAAEAAAESGWTEWLSMLVEQQRVTRLLTHPQSPESPEFHCRSSHSCDAVPEPSENAETTIAAMAAPAGGERLQELAAPTPLFVAAERLLQWQALHPAAALSPPIAAPADYADRHWTAEDAVVEIVRARLAALGPTTAAALAASTALPQPPIDAALIALETEGYVMRGRFTAGAADIEWCERHLLARIHRYTVRRLRREIEPVEPRDFMRFLFDWQRVAPGQQMHGPDALATILAQLEGFEAPAAAWESELLPARLAGYEISWLDDLCLAGRVVWNRLRAGSTSSTEPAAGPVRSTPIVLLQRRHLPLWTALADRARGTQPAPSLSSRAAKVAAVLAEHGALFFDELLDAAHLLHTELENALAELVAVGAVTSDSFVGLRALLVPASKRGSTSARRSRRRMSPFGIDNAGRWSLTRRAVAASSDAAPRRAPAPVDADHAEAVVHTLLRRYGVLSWRLLEREAPWLPPWRDLVRVCHRLEARGEIRGGRFIAGLSGEQFALPEAIAVLRKVRQQPADGTLVAVSGIDPLNLVGSIVAGARIPSLVGARVLYRDGEPVASHVAGVFTPLVPMDEAEDWNLRTAVVRDARHSAAVRPAGALSSSSAIHRV
jgi:ATP-dependent helicase Lhr and Lhr-like helicase